jgi:hypothetical protein
VSEEETKVSYAQLAKILNSAKVFQDEAGDLMFSVRDSERLLFDLEADPPVWRVYHK